MRPDILAAQRLPDSALEREAPRKGRYRSIVESEQHLHRNGTRIVKFFLHLSRNEQRERLLARIDTFRSADTGTTTCTPTRPA